MPVVVFDLDGVVCPGPSFSVALEAEHGIPASRLSSFFREVFPACIVGQQALDVVIAPRLAEWEWHGSVEEFLAFWFEREREVSQPVLACVQALREAGVICVLGTNQERRRIDFVRHEMKLADCFDAIYASCELGVAKPDMAFFEQIEVRVNRRDMAFWLVDDAARNVEAADSLGWQGVHYRGVADLALLAQATGIAWP